MSSKVVDLEDLIIKWAWDTFKLTRGKDYSKLELNDIKFDVVWDRVRFIAGKPEYSEQQTLERPNSQVVFKSVYENKTDQLQDHTFQTERSTVSSCSTTVSRGYTKGLKLELKLGLPDDIMAATAGFGREITMETSGENLHEEDITWSINSNIKVPSNHRTIAELVVKEQQYTASFKMCSRIYGHVVVILTNQRENNSFIQSVEADFCDIMDGQEQDNKQFSVEGKNVLWEVSGSCQFRYGIEQHVQLSESRLE